MQEQERRQFPRLSLDKEIEYTILGKEEPDLVITGTRNISSSGVCIIVFEYIEPGSLLGLKFVIPGVSNVMYAQGTVVWIRDKKTGKQASTRSAYEIGVIFNQIKEEDKAIIERFMLTKEKKS
ncbi:MAG: PilZ domain-containing protein [Candidatus Omnitrophica bacterium]|nr:PilZ domain-containing protein [Candidatus Omnitrophota bacterium]